ncbi:MAG: anhydro-N-acetylmuramic acid kinase [Brumimicrobium sp.]
MAEKNKYHVIGLMSGTSLDGIDVVEVVFYKDENQKWKFQLLNSELFEFEENILRSLKETYVLPAEKLIKLSADLGRYYGKIVNNFITKYKIDKSELDFVVSHGQTVFHQPQNGFTLQIGNGPELSVTTGLSSVTDFRTKDVALGGNGAPFIPVADFLLFSNMAESFLNLGGFSNYSFKQQEVVKSYDVCPVNIVVNHLVQSAGISYDKDGEIGKKGTVNHQLLESLNSLAFYQDESPKSLGWEWVVKEILPLLTAESVLENKIRTFYEHSAIQIGKVVNDISPKSVLITGGGVKNTFLMSRIKAHVKCEIVIPNEEVIDFKEAIGFAFLGLLRWRNEVNVWKSVTGAKKDSSSGVVYHS